jgi:glycosyltransferase involved in cell wall biosynthesis
MDATKGFDRLIAALPALVERYPRAELVILGDGPDRKALTEQARSLGVSGRVAMPGFRADVRTWLQSSDLFVLASRFEGLPNVLLEAIDAECPVAVLDHPGGTREIMELLGQSYRITTDLREWRWEWFERPGAEVRAAAHEHFGIEAIVRQYADVLRGVDGMLRAAA